MGKDLERTQRTREAMQQQGIDALVLRLPENVVMLSGYWPMNGFAFLVFAAEAEPVLIAPAPEEELARESWVNDIRLFPWGLVDSGDPYQSIAKLLSASAQNLGLAGKCIGYEGSFEFVAAPYVAAEPGAPSQVTLAMIRQIFGENLVDATGMIHKLRLYKTPAEIERLRTVNEIARMGLRAFIEHVTPGRSELEIAAAVEAAILQGGHRLQRGKSSPGLGFGDVWTARCSRL